VGPDIFLFNKIFKHPHFDIRIDDLPDVQIFHRDSWKHKEELSFLAQLQIPKKLQVIIFGINLNLNLP
jgi:hypothetical protein